MKKILIITILSVCVELFSSCGSDEIPQGIMSVETMAAFTADAYLIESYATAISTRYPDSLGYVLDAAYDSLYLKYDIYPETYDSSLSYYVRNPRLMKVIQERSLQILNSLEPEPEHVQSGEIEALNSDISSIKNHK